jgi:hypothetical protein
MDSILILIQPLDPATNSRVTVRLADGPSADIYGLGGVPWEPAILERPKYEIHLFDQDMSGKVQAGTANLGIMLSAIQQVPNADSLVWQSAPITIFNVNEVSWERRLVEYVGIVTSETKDIDQRHVTLSAATQTVLMDKPLLSARFSGAGGINGDAGKRGTLKPCGFGVVKNLQPIWFDQVRNIGMIDGYNNTLSIDWLGEGRNSFGPAVGEYASYNDLAAAIDNGSIPPGRWGKCVSQGLVGLGAPSAGIITVDAQFGVNLPGSLMYSILRARAGIAPVLMDISSFTAIDAAVPYPVSYWTAEQRNCLELVEAIAKSCNATPIVTFQGVISVTRAIVSTVAVATLDRSGGRTPRVLAWASDTTQPPYAYLTARAARPASVLTYDQIISDYDFEDTGLYDPNKTYRAGQVTWLLNGSQWLYINNTPDSGHAPPNGFDSDAYWQQMQPPTTAGDITYSDGTPLEDLKPGEYGSNITENRTAAAITGQSYLATQYPQRLYGSPDYGDLYLNASFITYSASVGGFTVQGLRPAEFNSNVTEGRTAAAIQGQQYLATNYPGRLFPHPDYGDVFLRADSIAYSANLGGNTVQGLRPGEYGANVTEARVSAAIDGQGTFATKNNANADDLLYGATGNVSIYYRQEPNDNNQTEWGASPGGVGLVSKQGTLIQGNFSFNVRQIGAVGATTFVRVVRKIDNTVVWGGAGGTQYTAPSDATTITISGVFFDTVNAGTYAQYDVQFLQGAGGNTRSTMRTVIVRELVRDKVDQVWLSAPMGEGPGAGNAGGGQINGDYTGSGGVTGTTPTGGNAGQGGLRGRTQQV